MVIVQGATSRDVQILVKVDLLSKIERFLTRINIR